MIHPTLMGNTLAADFSVHTDLTNFSEFSNTISPIKELGHERKQAGFINLAVTEFLLSSMIKSSQAAKFTISEVDSQKLICRASFDYLRLSTHRKVSLSSRPVPCPLLQ